MNDNPVKIATRLFESNYSALQGQQAERAWLDCYFYSIKQLAAIDSAVQQSKEADAYRAQFANS